MKRIALLLLSLAATPALADVTIIDNDQSITVDCAKDKNVNIVGNDATVTLKGVCEKVLISGNDATVNGSVKGAFISGNSNKLALEAVDGISVSGNDNTVSYKKPIAKKKVSVLNSGNGNKISQAK